MNEDKNVDYLSKNFINIVIKKCQARKIAESMKYNRMWYEIDRKKAYLRYIIIPRSSLMSCVTLVNPL